MNNLEQSSTMHKYTMFVRLVMSKILVRIFGYENDDEGGA